MTVVFYPSGERTLYSQYEGILVITDCYKQTSATEWEIDLDKFKKFWAENPNGKPVYVFGIEGPVCACCGNELDVCICADVWGDLNMTFEELVQLWESGADVPVDDYECIEQEWAGWPAGSYREDVWHWFDDLFAQHGTSLGRYLESGE